VLAKVENVVEKGQKTSIQGDRYAGIHECFILDKNGLFG
jgi:hypothetical protein